MVRVGDARGEIERAVEAREGARETDEHFAERGMDLRDSTKRKRKSKSTASSQRHLGRRWSTETGCLR